MPPASTEGRQTRNQILTFLIEFAELTAHYCAKPEAGQGHLRGEGLLLSNLAMIGFLHPAPSSVREGLMVYFYQVVPISIGREDVFNVCRAALVLRLHS